MNSIQLETFKQKVHEEHMRGIRLDRIMKAIDIREELKGFLKYGFEGFSNFL